MRVTRTPADGARRPRGDGNCVVDRVRAGHVHGDAGGRVRPRGRRRGQVGPGRAVRRAGAVARGGQRLALGRRRDRCRRDRRRRRGGRAGVAALAGRAGAGRFGGAALAGEGDGHPGGRTVGGVRRRVGAPRGGGRRPAAGPPAVALLGRPRVAAPAADRRTGRHLRRRRGALVPDPLRPRQPVDGADAAAVGHGHRGPDVAGAGSTAGPVRRQAHRRGARQDPARAAAAQRVLAPA